MQFVFLYFMKILTKFGDRVRTLRKEKSISQEKLAELADLHRTYVGDVERGERNISLINIEKIARALKIPLSKLMDLWRLTFIVKIDVKTSFLSGEVIPSYFPNFPPQMLRQKHTAFWLSRSDLSIYTFCILQSENTWIPLFY